MLFLQLKSGEYVTIGDEIAVQVFQDTGSKIRVAIKAPKEVSILRGEVRERNGAERPEGLVGLPPRE
ncbi:carbon storage regulator [Pseudoflavonifractor sp. 524-17]|uniref:carbon storage regulator n=1 Tax=Pseudoflavonifractor sp. 524-17 TaxID=2304577 RepID=UPI00137A75B7